MIFKKANNLTAFSLQSLIIFLSRLTTQFSPEQFRCATLVAVFCFDLKLGCFFSLSVDCVGILKLRNADVELRIGRNRAKKKSQTVRLVFRVLLDVTGNDSNNPLILQVVSNRIMCCKKLVV